MWLLLSLTIDAAIDKAAFGLIAFGRSGRLTGRPWMQPGNPGTHGAPVILVLGPELAGQGGLLVEADGGRADAPGHGGVFQQAWRAEQHHLACQDGHKADVDGVRT
jgi:hypothetical protein